MDDYLLGNLFRRRLFRLVYDQVRRRESFETISQATTRRSTDTNFDVFWVNCHY